MAEHVYAKDRAAAGVAWLALVIAILALVLGWVAYNRTGEDLENQIQTQVEKGLNAASDAAETTENAAQDAGNAIDAGPDGVDEDDTDVQTTNP